MRNFANFIAFQLVWFAAVGGAGHGVAWPALLSFAMFVAWHAGSRTWARGDAGLMAMAVVLGFGVDSGMAMLGLARYSAPLPFANSAPAWILALWAAFGLILQHSMRWLCLHPPWAAAAAAIVGPVSYYGAARLCAAVSIAEPVPRSLTVLGAAWFIAMGVLAMRVRHLARTSASEPEPRA